MESADDRLKALDAFATAAMMGYASHVVSGKSHDEIAHESYALAAAMLRARDAAHVHLTEAAHEPVVDRAPPTPSHPSPKAGRGRA